MDPLTEKLQQCYTGAVNDVMRAMGLSHYILPNELRPIIPGQVLAGPVFTISGHAADGADAHETLLQWTGLLSKAKSGHIWVAQPNENTVAQMGELSAETLQSKGVLGVVTDGLIRDVRFLLELDFQTWCKGFTPADVVSRWLPDGFDVPIKIGDVEILPGDFLLGDHDGLIRIPKALCAEVVERSLEAIAKESLVRKAILEGIDPQEAYLQYGKF